MYLNIGNEVMQFENTLYYSKVRFSASNSTTLRQYITEKSKSKRRVWELTINPTDIDSELKSRFLEKFFCSSNRAISIDGINYREVFVSEGDFPVEWFENCKFLQQVRFTVTSKAPDDSLLVGESLFE